MLHFFSGIACIVLSVLFAYLAMFFRTLPKAKAPQFIYCTPRILLWICRVVYIGYLVLAYKNFINIH